MAIYYFHTDPVNRGTGRQATGAAAYISGERIADERTGKVHDHSHRQDVLHKEIVLPSEFAQGGADWAKNREKLWNAAEHAERQRNSRVAREYTVALPSELSPDQRTTLARAFSQELADRYKVAVDLAVHEPRPGGDARNFHAHLLTTTREITADGLGAKAGLDMSTVVRRERGIDGQREFFALRERWAALTNEALREANIDARVDHRRRAAYQQADGTPSPAQRQEDREVGNRDVAANTLRSPVQQELRASVHESYRQAVAAHLERAAQSSEAVQGRPAGATSETPRRSTATPASNAVPAAPNAVPAVPNAAAPAGSNATPAAPNAVPAASKDAPVAAVQPVSGAKLLEEIRRQAREAWLRLRAKEVERGADQHSGATFSGQGKPGHEAPSTSERSGEPGRQNGSRLDAGKQNDRGSRNEDQGDRGEPGFPRPGPDDDYSP